MGVCCVDFMRNGLDKVGKSHAEMVAATIRTIFAQPGPTEVRPKSTTWPACSRASSPPVAQLLLDVKIDLTAFADFTLPHWCEI